MSKELLQQALEFVEFCWRDVPMNAYAADKRDVIEEVLRAAIAQPVQQANIADETLLEIARATGLRSHLQGVNATDAKLLLRQYVEAVCAAIAQPVHQKETK